MFNKKDEKININIILFRQKGLCPVNSFEDLVKDYDKDPFDNQAITFPAGRMDS